MRNGKHMWMQRFRSCSNTIDTEMNRMKIKEKNKRWITIAVLAAAACMIAAGIVNGEPVVVLTKATSICMQCIGLD